MRRIGVQAGASARTRSFGHTTSVQRVPFPEFDSVLEKHLDELWGKPVNLYRALGNHPALAAAFYAMVSRMLDAMRVELDDDVRDYSPKLP